MKWPASVMLVRHDKSAYNALREKKKQDALYKDFLVSYRRDETSLETRALALQVAEKFALRVGDAQTPLADKEGRQAYETGQYLSRGITPDVIFVSPYDRALHTLEHIARGWPALKGIKTYRDERVREQEHGSACLYNDWRVFEVLHPEQKLLRSREGSYWYRYPQGENVPDMRLRNRSWLTTIVREFSGKHLLVVTHHLNILATRANLERLDPAAFIHLDNHEKPINCGVTLYRGYPDEGKDGKLKLEYYNAKRYK